MKILYRNNKWGGIWDNPKYEKIREVIKSDFSGLTFIEEGHKYFLNGKPMTCVSDVTHLFKEHFYSKQKREKGNRKGSRIWGFDPFYLCFGYPCRHLCADDEGEPPIQKTAGSVDRGRLSVSDGIRSAF